MIQKNMKYNPNQLLLLSQLLKKNQRKKVKKVLKETKLLKMSETESTYNTTTPIGCGRSLVDPKRSIKQS